MMRVDSVCVFWRCSDRIVFRLYFRLVLIWAIYSRLSCKAVPGHLGKKKRPKKRQPKSCLYYILALGVLGVALPLAALCAPNLIFDLTFPGRQPFTA